MSRLTGGVIIYKIGNLKCLVEDPEEPFAHMACKNPLVFFVLSGSEQEYRRKCT